MKFPLLPILLALCCLFALSACASNPAVHAAPAGTALPPPDASITADNYSSGTDYHIGAQDLLEISVLGVPDLSRTVRVNANGQISLPLIGAVRAGGETIPQLQTRIADALGKSYLQHPEVSVFVKDSVSQRITMEGSFKKPGIYTISGKTTLLQASALAGGLDPLAKSDKVVVFRTVDGKKMAAVFDMDKISKGQAPDPQVYGDDVIVVDQSGAKSAWKNFIQATPLIGLFLLL